MAADAPLDVEQIITTLARNDVRYLVVGGIAAIVHGWAGATADFDAVASFDADNRDRLAAALAALDASAPDWDGTAQTLGRHTAWSFMTVAGRLDLLFVLEPYGTYDDLRPGGTDVPAFGAVIPVVALDDLIALKRALGRPKDLRVVVELEELRRHRS